MKLSETLYQYFQEEARKSGWSFGPLTLPSVESTGKPERSETLGLIADLHPIILAGLGDELDAARTKWADAQRLAARVRTTVVAASGEDLILVFFGYVGSKENADWRALAMEIERNDLVCRKLVWLPPKKQSKIAESLSEFIRRTFLSKPWLARESIVQTALDTLSLKDAELHGWDVILDAEPINRHDVDYDALVAKLIQANP